MTLQPGAKGPDVIDIQNQLRSLGYSLTVDGIYGEQTSNAVMSFQANNHLLPDGIAGPDTLTVLNGALADQSVRGIDVSCAQGLINWDAVKTGGATRFALIKCTEGATYQDPRFSSNLSEVQRAGLTYGAYHFFRFFTSDPLPQAANLKATAGTTNFGSGTFPIVVDVEYQDVNGTTNAQVTANAAQCAANLKIFIDQVSRDFGRPPVIYTNADFWNNIFKSPAGFNNLKLWVADYGSSTGPRIPNGWTDFNIWQYTSTARIEGITGLVDINVIKGNMADLIR